MKEDLGARSFLAGAFEKAVSKRGRCFLEVKDFPNVAPAVDLIKLCSFKFFVAL